MINIDPKYVYYRWRTGARQGRNSRWVYVLFTNIGRSLASNILPGSSDYKRCLSACRQDENIYIALTDPMEILQIINYLKSKKTPGPDRISTHLLKEIGPEIFTVLSMAVKKSISSVIVPSCPKMARITPIHKD